ncbi:Group 4 capsule polysaccharide lipoprotein gfcB, YjbF [Cribrihabitans marinus]|uniref:Group 4 capsule polysaccharide lipoprotein gfcB, YjbF n=1 Tax=Cribrihabitans marinus TaxID=1227549 RepID=A0A1H7DXB2_9RHOB|nr:YjbF family lipoprotein [Cribrihabitans marinus]GGH41024.1 hypothetical protein GCM10010973_37710 [Cribrihabitans marinus]SEK06409.1 Group 4 capsule polysaccharide lipoprotein gfcB, YjbF [Cribrihabitans marinus]
MSRRFPPWVLIPLLVLTGCGGGTNEVPLEVQLLQAGQASIAGRRAQRPTVPDFTRAQLDKIEGALMEATLERENQTGLLFITAERPQGITVWRSGDDVTFAMRNGVLVATRGLGGDVLSSSVQVSGRQPGPSSGGAHVQMLHSLDNRQVQLALACDLVDLGPETIEIVERRHATRHLQQRCTGGGGQVTNDYWVDRGAGVIWQSRQWAGPHIGYLTFRQLKR